MTPQEITELAHQRCLNGREGPLYVTPSELADFIAVYPVTIYGSRLVPQLDDTDPNNTNKEQPA